MHSCLYRGRVSDRRGEPEHQFSYSTSWAYFDLSEIDTVVQKCRLLSKRRFAAISFRREDHFGESGDSLMDSVREKLQRETQIELNGPVIAHTISSLWFVLQSAQCFLLFRFY